MTPLVVYVDVDDTLIRSVGSKRIPIVAAVEHVRQLAAEGAVLYCWSSGGGDYARASAGELGLTDCFAGFLPKPHSLLDDQPVDQWRRLIQVHPLEAPSWSAERYRRTLAGAPEGPDR
jgi:hypothetical protein